MRKGPEKKRLLRTGRRVLLLLVIVGVWLYHPSPQQRSEDKNTPNLVLLSTERQAPSTPAPPSSKVGNTFIPSPALQRQPASLAATHIGDMANAALLGVCWWLSRYYTSPPKGNHQKTNFTLVLRWPHYTAAILVSAAMVGYIGYFCYQAYRVTQGPPARLQKGIGLLALLGIGTSTLLYPALFAWLSQGYDKLLQLIQAVVAEEKHFLQLAQQTGDDDMEGLWLPNILITMMKEALCKRICIGCSSHIIIYTLMIKLIAYFKSKHKPIAHHFSRQGYSIWLFSTVVLSSIWGLAVDPATWGLLTKLLWALPACFVYVQAFWDPTLPPMRHKALGATRAWLFHPSHLWEGLIVAYRIGYVKADGYTTIQQWAIWECFKWGLLYHLEIKKASDSKEYTVSFPLDARELLEVSVMILSGIYGAYFYILFPKVLATRLQKNLSKALLLLVGLWIKLHLHPSKSPISRWASLLGHGLVSISGSIAAIFYLRSQAPNDEAAALILGGGGLLVLVLYIVPKHLQRIATALRAEKKTPAPFRKIAQAALYATTFSQQLTIMETIYLGVLGLLTKAAIQKNLNGPRSYWLVRGICYFISYLALLFLLKHLLQQGKLRILDKWGGAFTILYAWGAVVAFYSQYRYRILSDAVRYFPFGLLWLEGSLLVGLPYALHRLTSFALTWTKMPSILQSIVRTLQDFTAFWLHPNLDVVYTAILTSLGSMVYTYHCRKHNIWILILVLFEIIIAHTLALLLYATIEVLFYSFATRKHLAGLLEHALFFWTFTHMLQLAHWHTSTLEWAIHMLGYLLCYLAVVVFVQRQLNTLQPKGYRKTPLPAFKHVERLFDTIFAYLYLLCLGCVALLKSFVWPARRPNIM